MEMEEREGRERDGEDEGRKVTRSDRERERGIEGGARRRKG